MLDQSRKKTPN